MNKRRRITSNTSFKIDTASEVNVLSIRDLTTYVFFDNYISKRIPLKILGHIENGSFSKWTNDYLKQKSGNEPIKVEKKLSTCNCFGKGNEVHMTFGSFIDSLEGGDSSLYLTTQELIYDMEGRPSIISSPIQSLKHDYPWNPNLTQNLIISNINLWIGSTKRDEWVTSGLHHDYHDNMYIVLRGRKKFLLFSPKEANNMYTYGTISKIHENGRINYVGQPTRADGVDIGGERARDASLALETANQKLEQALKAAKEKSETENKEESVEEAEEEVEAALEAMLDAEIDDEEEEEEEEEGAGGEDESEEEEEEEEGVSVKSDEKILARDCERVRRGRQTDKKSSNSEEISEAVANTGTGSSLSPLPKQRRGDKSRIRLVSEMPSATSKAPLSFSRVDTSLPEKRIREEFPLFADALYTRKVGVSVEVCAGEMLYLPAGWFHEVKSNGEAPLGHMAFNYWYHPPDGTEFNQPYKSDFWLNDWKMRNMS